MKGWIQNIIQGNTDRGGYVSARARGTSEDIRVPDNNPYWCATNDFCWFIDAIKDLDWEWAKDYYSKVGPGEWKNENPNFGGNVNV